MYSADLFYITISINIYCKNVKKKIIYILYLDYVLFIWRKLDGCIYIRLSYCKAKLKLKKKKKKKTVQSGLMVSGNQCLNLWSQR